jgi:DNA (cytosine-5)-methyltransferase 1
MKMRHGSLFSGIGGFDLAAEWAGWQNVFQCEIDPWCQKILTKNFPQTKRYSDVKKFDGTEWKGAVDIISGGFPCQPYSAAGKRRGKEDERHLWPEMLRIISEAQPRWVVGENVFGLISWSDGLVFEEVCIDLEAAGYEVQPFVLPAASVNATHQRQRVWFVAHSKGEAAAYADNKRFKKQHIANEPDKPERITRDNATKWDEWTTEPAVCRMDDGIPHRVDRIRGLGNAIVPQVAFEIFQAINNYNSCP